MTTRVTVFGAAVGMGFAWLLAGGSVAQDRPADKLSRPVETQNDATRNGDAKPEAGAAANSERQSAAALGVFLAPSPTGVLVEHVERRSGADRAGIRPGDFLLSLNDTKVNSRDEVRKALGGLKAGAQVAVTLWRDGETQEMKVTLTEHRPAGFGGGIRDGRGGRGRFDAWLGVALDDAGEDDGASVEAIFPRGPAACAGLRRGDEIRTVDGNEVSNARAVADAIDEMAPGHELELGIRRDGENRTLTVRLADRPHFPRHPGFDDRPWNDWDERGRGQDRGIPHEQIRHMAEQHQRLEERIDRLLGELQSLQEQLRAGAGKEPSGEDRPPGHSDGH